MPMVLLGLVVQDSSSLLPWFNTNSSTATSKLQNDSFPAAELRMLVERRTASICIDCSNTTLLDMASWMHSHAIVIMAASAAVTEHAMANAIFMRSCGVVILLDPDCRTGNVSKPLLETAGVNVLSAANCETPSSSSKNVSVSPENLAGLVRDAFQARTKCLLLLSNF
jgi:hypothetical protein